MQQTSEKTAAFYRIGLEVAAAHVRKAATARTTHDACEALLVAAQKGFGPLALPIFTVLQRQSGWQLAPQTPEILSHVHDILLQDFPASPLLQDVDALVAETFRVQPTVSTAHILCRPSTKTSARLSALSFLFNEADAAAARGDVEGALGFFPSLDLVQAPSDVRRLALMMERALCLQVGAVPSDIVRGAKLYFEAQQDLEAGLRDDDLRALSPERVVGVLARCVSISVDQGDFTPDSVMGYKLLLKHLPHDAERKRVAFSFVEQAIEALPQVPPAAVPRAVSVMNEVLHGAPHSNSVAGKMFDLALSLLETSFDAAESAAESAVMLATEVPMRQQATALCRWIDNPQQLQQPAFLPDRYALKALYNDLGLNTLTQARGGADVISRKVKACQLGSGGVWRAL